MGLWGWGGLVRARTHVHDALEAVLAPEVRHQVANLIGLSLDAVHVQLYPLRECYT